jgi:hypothetical protein
LYLRVGCPFQFADGAGGIGASAAAFRGSLYGKVESFHYLVVDNHLVGSAGSFATAYHGKLCLYFGVFKSKFRQKGNADTPILADKKPLGIQAVGQVFVGVFIQNPDAENAVVLLVAVAAATAYKAQIYNGYQ